MATICDCNARLNNTGAPNCEPLAQAAFNIILVPLVANDGTVHKILNTDTINTAFIDGKLQNTDYSKRWYPLTPMDNVEDVRGDATFFTASSGSNTKVQDGIRTFNALLLNTSPQYLKKISGFGCSSIGMYIIDLNGNLIGHETTQGELLPLPINKGSWNPNLVPATDTVPQHVSLNFEFTRTLKDENIKMILSTEITGTDLTTIGGLIETTGINLTSVTATGFTIEIVECYGSFADPNKVTGLVLADFELLDGAGAAITITSVTPTSNSYVFVIPSNPADTLELGYSAAGLAKGFGDTELRKVAITTP